jgi:hypothetical protein
MTAYFPRENGGRMEHFVRQELATFGIPSEDFLDHVMVLCGRSVGGGVGGGSHLYGDPPSDA